MVGGAVGGGVFGAVGGGEFTFGAVVAGAFAGGFVSGGLGTAFNGGNFFQNAFVGAIGSTVVAATMYGVAKVAGELYKRWNSMPGAEADARSQSATGEDRVLTTDKTIEAQQRWFQRAWVPKGCGGFNRCDTTDGSHWLFENDEPISPRPIEPLWKTPPWQSPAGPQFRLPPPGMWYWQKPPPFAPPPNASEPWTFWPPLVPRPIPIH